MAAAAAGEVNIREKDANLRIAPTKQGGLKFTAVKAATTMEFTLPAERLKELQSAIAQAIITNPALGDVRERSM